MSYVPVGSFVWTPIGIGSASSCVLVEGGGVKCWGYGDSLLGYGGYDNLGEDEPVSSLRTLDVGSYVDSVGSGESHHCALDYDGDVYCWGYIVNEGLGYASTAPILSATSAGPVDVGAEVTQLSVGNSHVCVVTENGGARCWGAPHALGYPDGNAVGDDEVPASKGDILF